MSSAAIKGVIAVSGVYRIPPGKLDLNLGGSDPHGFRFDEIAPFRGDHSTPLVARSGVPFRLNVFGAAFGDDPETRADASPITHVRPGLPPFLIFNAERDLPTLTLMAEEFDQALRLRLRLPAHSRRWPQSPFGHVHGHRGRRSGRPRYA